MTSTRISQPLPGEAGPRGTTRLALTNAISLVGTFGVTSLLGMGFWLVAARYYSKSAVGFTGGLISAMTLLGQFCTLGLSTMLIGELPRRRTPPRALVSSAMAASGAAGIVGGLLFVLIAPLVSGQYHRLGTIGMIFIFCVGVALTASTAIFDGATIGVLRGGLQLQRNAIFAGMKLITILGLALLLSHDVLSLISAWVSGILVSLGVAFVIAHHKTIPMKDYRPSTAALTGLWRNALWHHAFNLAFSVPTLMLPILVLGFVSATANASFYISLQIASALYIVPIALTTVLFAVGTLEPETLAYRIRATLLISGVVAALGIGVLAVTGDILLRQFGSSYADGRVALVVLAVASLPLTVKTHFLAVSRIEGKMEDRLPLVWGGAVVEILAAAFGASFWGVTGATVGWVAVLCAEAIVMSRPVQRVAYRRRATLVT